MDQQSQKTDDNYRLFSEEDLTVVPELSPEPETSLGTKALWTDHKAQFIMFYLQFFVFITKHGTYIDGFAGPQEECETESWAAKLVLANRPRWIRHFHLCDASRAQVERLKGLKAAQPERDEDGHKINRTIDIYHGDFNVAVDQILSSGTISENEATFCLLDQRTFECTWTTVAKLARYKKTGNKIELFYFLANNWFERALSGLIDMKKLARWWGRDDWLGLKEMSRDQRRDMIVDRLKSEFGYKSVKAYPIFKTERGKTIMYFMIHATDHPEGPIQMARAYRAAVRPPEPDHYQISLFADPKGPESHQRGGDLSESLSA
jgi:three-Cys-motif partner protein